MSTERKEKVAKRKAERQSKKTSPEVGYPSTHSENGRVLDAATVTADSNLDPLTAKAEVQNPAGIADRQTRPVGYPLPKLEPITGQAVVQNPAGLSEINDGRLPSLPDIKGQAVVQNPSGLAGAEEKPMTLSDYLAEQRANLQKDKTDSVKMQKYYALTDALKALGQMGGSAIGGAIGGNVLDSAPAVDAYKESRGYLDAIENAKQANERLRALDDKAFNLALRDEERSYEQQQKKLDRDFQRDMKKLDAELRAAEADKDFQKRAELQKEMAELQHQHDMEKEELRAKSEKELRKMIIEGNLAEKRISKEIVDTQMGKSGSSSSASATGGTPVQTRFTGKKIPVIFKDKTMVDIPSDAYDVIKDSIMGQEIGDELVDKDNVNRIIRDNPQLVNEYMKILGLIEPTASAQKIGQADIETPINLSSDIYPYYQYVDNVNPANKPSNYVEANPENGTFEISGYKRK